MNGRKSFSKNVKRHIFEKLTEVPNKDPKIWRMDLSGNIICYPSYGDYNSRYGWNIHHINENPLENTLINLEATSYELHNKYHNHKN